VPSPHRRLLKLTATASPHHPALESHGADDGIHRPRAIDIGVAVDTDAGLVAAGVRNCVAGLRQSRGEDTRPVRPRPPWRMTADGSRGGCFRSRT